jgi:hypothetical protein
MKTTFFKALVIFAVLLNVSCSKDDSSSSGGGASGAANGLFYGENGAAASQTVDTPYASDTFNSVFAVNSGSTVIEMNLSDIAVGSYAIDATNAFTYIKPGQSNFFIGSAGTIVITANASGKLTGTFSITAGSGIVGVNSVSGTFKNIVINP